MKAKLIIDDMTGQDRITAYLAQCRVVEESDIENDPDAPHFPPSKDEVVGLVKYLRAQGANPLVVGGVGVLSYLKGVDPRRGFRPTTDLDLWVDFVPKELPSGWAVDRESPGTPSWISPTGGYVDFITPGREFPGGERSPKSIDHDPETFYTEFPVASWLSIFRLKLNSVREKDLADSIALVRSMGRVPAPTELGKLNGTQRENLDLIQQWFKLRPVGNYGE